MFSCPICGGEVVPDQNQPGKYLCYHCKKRIPQHALKEIPDIVDNGMFDVDEYEDEPYEDELSHEFDGGRPISMPQNQYREPSPYNAAEQSPYGVPSPMPSEGYPPQQIPYGNNPSPYGQGGYGAYPQDSNNPYVQPQAPYDPNHQSPSAPQQQKGKALGIIGLVLGLLALLAALVPLIGIIVVIPFALAALIVGIIAIFKSSPRILGILAVVFAVLSIPAMLLSSYLFAAAVIEDNGGNMNAIIDAAQNDNQEAVNELINGVVENIETNSNELPNGEGNANVNDTPNAPESTDTNPAAQDIHGTLAPGGYYNNFFGITVSDLGGQYEVIGGPEAKYDVRAIQQADRKNTLTGTSDSIAAASVDAYLMVRQNMEGGDISTVTVAGQEVPAHVVMRSYPEGSEWQITVCKIVDGCQFDLTAIASTEEAARALFETITTF